MKLATEKTPVDTLDRDCAALLEALAGFALRYVDGHRAQTQMFDDDEDEDDGADDGQLHMVDYAVVHHE